MLITVYSNNRNECNQYKRSIEKGIKKALNYSDQNFTVHAIKTSCLEKELKEIQKRKKRDNYNPNLLLDQTDILFIDSDCIDLNNIFLGTGESILKTIRLFTNCKVIILLNKYGDNFFDLSLREGLKDWADFNIGSKQLSNANLWKKNNFKGFRPWTWPNLLNIIYDYEFKLEDTLNSLDKPLYKVLGISKKIISFLPRKNVEYISSQRTYNNLIDITLREHALESDYIFGLDKNKNTYNDTILAKGIVSFLSKWIEIILIQEGELYDIPSLIRKYAFFLLPEERISIKKWNKYITFNRHTEELPLFTDYLEKARIKDKYFWYSKIVWDGFVIEKLHDEQKLWEYYDTKKSPTFCEDASKFYNTNETRIFYPLIENVSSFRKNVKVFKNIDYTPFTFFELY